MQKNKIYEFITVNTRLRVCVISSHNEDWINDISFLQYRLGGVKKVKNFKKMFSDIIWYPDVDNVGVDFSQQNHVLILYGNFPSGDIQKFILAMFNMRLQENGKFNFHSTSVRYKDKNILFLAGEENHGKTMSLIETVKRGGLIIGTESTIIDKNLDIMDGSKEVFLLKRSKGTERTDLPPTTDGVWKFFDTLPKWNYAQNPGKLDLIILPDIDGNFDTFVSKLNDYEKKYQLFISLTETFFMAHYILSSGIPFPLMDYNDLRKKRYEFVDYISKNIELYLIRAKNPQLIIDEVEKIIS